MQFLNNQIRLFCLSLFLLVSSLSVAQQNQPEPVPNGGRERVTSTYYRIRFNPDQRLLIKNQSIQVVLAVDEEGFATMDNVSGINDASIIDSLYAVTPNLPRFSPARKDGVAQSGLYQVVLKFSQSKNAEPEYGEEEMRAEENPGYQKTGYHSEILFAGMVNTTSGNSSYYLRGGGGLRMDLILAGPMGNGWGVVLGIYMNGRQREYPVYTFTDQNEVYPTLVIGIARKSTFLKKEKYSLGLQVEACYATQQVAPSIDEYQDNAVSFRGFSPAFSLHYTLRVGKENVNYYMTPSVFSRNLNLHAGVRPFFFNQRQASGVLFEAGIGLRLNYELIE